MKETQKEDLQLYQVADDYSGELKEVKKPPQSLKSTNVYILVNDLFLKIYVWIGAETNVRARFIGAQSAQSLQRVRGATYHVITVEGRDEIEEFNQLLALVGSSIQFDHQPMQKEELPAQVPKKVSKAPSRKVRQKRLQVTSSSATPSQENLLELFVQMREDISVIKEDIQVIKTDLQAMKGKRSTRKKKK
ncbi:MAG: hypothetical protein ACFFB3_08140 [Candidatus Hodarchaeota archaeon]